MYPNRSGTRCESGKDEVEPSSSLASLVIPLYLSMSQTQAKFSCRDCKAEVLVGATQCPKCGCKAPFACAECGKAISSVTLGVKRSHKYPYGSYSASGLPLCADHRFTRCHQCSELFPLHVTKRKSIGERADTNLRRGMSPRMEKIYGSFCPDCYMRSPGEASASRSDRRQRSPNYRMFIVLLVLALLAVGGIAVVLILAR